MNKELKRFNLFPNPNDGAATIAYELTGETAALWQVFDVNGKLLHEMSLPVGLQQKQVKMSGLPNGVYHFVVSLKEARLFNGKMVVTKQ